MQRLVWVYNAAFLYMNLITLHSLKWEFSSELRVQKAKY